MSNVVEQLMPNPVNHKHGENGCCKNPRAWEMEMMHQVWAAGLHDAANCFQDALEVKWEFESQRKVKPKTNSDRIRGKPFRWDRRFPFFVGAAERKRELTMGERDRGVPYGGNEETFWITQARGNPGGKEITMDEIELKPCPFCGGEAMLTTNLYAGIVYIQCKCCTAMVGRKRKIVSSMIGKEYFVNKEEAIEAWNRRADNG